MMAWDKRKNKDEGVKFKHSSLQQEKFADQEKEIEDILSTNELIYQQLQLWGNDILRSDNFKNSENNIQHGVISVRIHSLNVAIKSVEFVEKFHISCNREDLVRGALLHDYFLYDWHIEDKENPHKWHGFHHANTALQNAKKEYKLSKRQSDIIKKHMWPLTVIPPRYKESWIVTLVDKYCSLFETFHVRNDGIEFIKEKIYI